ncbi:autotransporter assembly complex protein TamA [Methylocystis sp. WRRC1]|uniref:autotransporter assembly complex protein TamA n=1 Tax=Methylocystis sp. WRRC1 TaxID=1732014 RepID=UPI001D132B11|nr:autotransporter assembly complex protein TamA [Methylocystis sp. WRRC1]
MKPDRLSFVAVVCAIFVFGGSEPSRAFDFFGLFGEPEKATPNPETVAYEVSFAGLDGDGALDQNLKDASNSWRLRLESPDAGVGLARRVVADYPRLTDALWANGYFNATVRASVAGVAVSPEGHGVEAAAAAAERYRNAALVPVRFEIDPGPVFKLRHVVVYDARTNAPIDPALFSRKALGVEPDEPARAAAVRAREAEWVDQLRDKSYPLAKVVSSRPVILHREHAMDVAVTIDPGPRAGIGEVQLSGSSGVDPDVIRSFIYLEEGEPYSPKKLADTRRSVARIEALGGVKVSDGDRLDKNGNLPILVETSERKRHVIGAAAMFSNINGPALRAYWMDRNLFGGGERLRVDLEGGLAYYNNSSAFLAFPHIEASNLVGLAHVGFLKPALWGTRNDLLLDASAVRERTVYYWASYGNFTGAIRHRFSDTASIQGGIEVEGGQFFDAWGLHNYSLLGFPLSGNYDSTDNALAPTRGVRVVGRVTPYVNALPHGVGMVESKGQASAYYALDEDAWRIIAGRVAVGSIVGASIENIPASHRFFAGGGGSVRGYRYKSISPYNGFDFPTGGRSLFEASLEARLRVTQNIGVVPFFDIGAAFSSPWPDFGSTLRAAAGLGLRYYTAIGPIRVDVATPLNPRPVDSRIALFIGIGESF